MTGRAYGTYKFQSSATCSFFLASQLTIVSFDKLNKNTLGVKKVQDQSEAAL